MLRKLVLLLLLANLAWFAWAQGWLRPLGLAPASPAEPERVRQQVRPELLRVRPAAPEAPAPPAAEPPPEAAAAPPPPDTDTDAASAVCLQAGVFDERQVVPLRRAAAALPEGSWRIDTVQLPGRWMVYVGKLADAGAVATKRAELRALGLDTDRAGGALEPGLSLGRFSSQEAADRALSELGRKGVRTARVVQERRDATGYLLRLPAVDDALQARLDGVRAALDGRELRACD